MDRGFLAALILVLALIAAANAYALSKPATVANTAHDSLPRVESLSRMQRSAQARRTVRPQPIRIKVAEVQQIADQEVRALLVNDLFPAAVSSLASILRVWTPLESNLTLPRTCSSVNSTTGLPRLL